MKELLKKLICKLFPNTINAIIAEANIIADYGSMEEYYKALNVYAKHAQEEADYYQQLYEEEQAAKENHSL
jgi:hypothetical protein